MLKNKILRVAILIAPLFVLNASWALEQDSGANIQVQVELKSTGGVFADQYQSQFQSSQVQTLVVSDGLEGRIFVGEHLPYVQWYYNYVKNEGYWTGNIVFQDVGSSLIVRPRVVGNRIEITLTPELSYQTGDSRGSIAVRKLSTTVLVSNGQTIEIAALAQQSQFRDYFYRSTAGQSLQVFLTPRVLD